MLTGNNVGFDAAAISNCYMGTPENSSGDPSPVDSVLWTSTGGDNAGTSALAMTASEAVIPAFPANEAFAASAAVVNKYNSGLYNFVLNKKEHGVPMS